MKLGTSTINIGLGAASVRGGYVGHLSLTQAPDGPAPSLYPLYEEVGDWATNDWPAISAAPAYSPTLAAPVFNITDYGADPTGTLDSTAAMTAALAACETAGGGTVYAPAGEYVFFPATSALPTANTVTFPIHFDGVTIEGDGPTETIFNFRAIAGVDPASEILERGNAFGSVGTTGPLDGITLRGFRATGNAPPTNTAGEWSMAGHATGWDIHHKFWYSAGGQVVTNIVIEYCELDNWRGEICYSGGGTELGNFTFRRCVIRGCNASAVSAGGNVLVENCDIYATYNGTECLAMDSPQGLTVRNTRVRPRHGLPSGVGIGKFGVVYLGFPTAQLTVEDCHLGDTYNGAIFLSESASNVTIQNNDFFNTLAIYSLFLNQYSDFNDKEDVWNDWLIQNNTLTVSTRPIDAFLLSFDQHDSNMTITGNTMIYENGFSLSSFIDIGGSQGDFIVTDNVIGDVLPAAIDTYRPTVWTGNTVSGYHANGIGFYSYDEAVPPIAIGSSWGKAQIIAAGGPQQEIYIPSGDLAYYPTGFVIEIRRTGDGADTRAAEVKPDAAWNTLSRGYMLVTGGVLSLTKNASGKFDFTSFTPNTANVRTLTQTPTTGQATASIIAVFGQLSVNLSPAVAQTYSSHTGVAIGETITINVNANVTLSHVPGVLEMSNGVDYVSAGTVALSATRAADGTLEVTIP